VTMQAQVGSDAPFDAVLARWCFLLVR
jgi:hypothetical protein